MMKGSSKCAFRRQSEVLVRVLEPYADYDDARLLRSFRAGSFITVTSLAGDRRYSHVAIFMGLLVKNQLFFSTANLSVQSSSGKVSRFIVGSRDIFSI